MGSWAMGRVKGALGGWAGTVRAVGGTQGHGNHNTAFVQKKKPSNLLTVLSLQTKFSLVVLGILIRWLGMGMPRSVPTHPGADKP